MTKLTNRLRREFSRLGASSVLFALGLAYLLRNVPVAPWIVEVRAELAAALGDSDENTRLLGEALALYREIGAHGHAERLASTSRARA